MTNNQDITIIGGGIIGLLTAREFYKAGATVAIIEKMALGRNRHGLAAAFCYLYILGGKMPPLPNWYCLALIYIRY